MFDLESEESEDEDLIIIGENSSSVSTTPIDNSTSSKSVKPPRKSKKSTIVAPLHLQASDVNDSDTPKSPPPPQRGLKRQLPRRPLKRPGNSTTGTSFFDRSHSNTSNANISTVQSAKDGKLALKPSVISSDESGMSEDEDGDKKRKRRPLVKSLKMSSIELAMMESSDEEQEVGSSHEEENIARKPPSLVSDVTVATVTSEPDKSLIVLGSVEAIEPLIVPSAINNSMEEENATIVVESDTEIEQQEEEVELDPEFQKLKEAYMDSAPNHSLGTEPVLLEMQGYKHPENDIPGQDVMFRISPADTMEKAMVRFAKVKQKQMDDCVFLMNGVIVSKFSTAGHLKVLGKLVIDVMTKEFYEKWKNLDTRHLLSNESHDVEIKDEFSSDKDDNDAQYQDAENMIKIKLNHKGKVEFLTVSKMSTFDKVLAAYRIICKLDAEAKISLKFDGEKISDFSQILDEFGIDEDDQLDVSILTA